MSKLGVVASKLRMVHLFFEDGNAANGPLAQNRRPKMTKINFSNGLNPQSPFATRAEGALGGLPQNAIRENDEGYGFSCAEVPTEPLEKLIFVIFGRRFCASIVLQ